MSRWLDTQARDWLIYRSHHVTRSRSRFTKDRTMGWAAGFTESRSDNSQDGFSVDEHNVGRVAGRVN
jgi:hypothetical protein